MSIRKPEITREKPNPFLRPLTERAFETMDKISKIIPDLADALVQGSESSPEEAQNALKKYMEGFATAITGLLRSKTANNDFHYPPEYYADFPPILDLPSAQLEPKHKIYLSYLQQRAMYETIGISLNAQENFFESILDPSGEKARLNRPTPSEISRVLSLKGKTPEETYNIWGSVILPDLSADAEYQRNRAPYRGRVGAQNYAFYQKYEGVPEGLHTVNSEVDSRQGYTHELENLLFKRNVDTGYFGVGKGREKFIADAINSLLESISSYKKNRKPSHHYGFDTYPASQAPEWLTEYYQIPIENLSKHPELSRKLFQLFAFGSPFMDILERVKYAQAILGAAHILKEGGRFCNDQAIPFTYTQEETRLHRLFPEEPSGMFARAWQTGEANPPAKFFYACPTPHEYYLMGKSGFDPENFSYEDSVVLEEKLHEFYPHEQNFLSTLHNPRNDYKPLSPIDRRISKVAYQTRDGNGRWYSRKNMSWVKNRNPDKLHTLFINFLANSPAFAPKPEE